MSTAPICFHFPLPEYRHVSGDQLIVRLRVEANHHCQQIMLRTEPENEELLTPMQLEFEDDNWQWWAATVDLAHHELTFLYCFKILGADQQFWLDAAGLSSRMPLRQRQFRWLTENVPPRWVLRQVFYQILPDRFRNGAPELSVQNNEYQYFGSEPVKAMPWGSKIPSHGDHISFFGGDLHGVQQGLDYLDDLGINAVYLNPVFTAPSTHKYDTEDYLNVDPHLGGNLALQALCEDVHRRDMRIVLDAVLNHTSENHPWFNRWHNHHEEGAYQEPLSITGQKYFFFDHNNPESYHCWKGAKTLPTLDWDHAEVQDYFCHPDHGVLAHWLKPPYSVDGWRLDVIHMLGDGLGAYNNGKRVRQIRQAIKNVSPSALVLGEHFFEASRWLQGDMEDAAMNYYGFATPVRAFLAGQDVVYHPCRIDAQEFDQWLSDARNQLAFEHQRCQLNLLGSHDTARFFTLVDEHLPTMKQAVLLLMTYIGVPAVYYGDEIGMTGHTDPYCRGSFEWDEKKWNTDLRDWYRRCIVLRRQMPVLQTGAYYTLYAKGDLFVFCRFNDQYAMVVAVNRSDKEQSAEIDLRHLNRAPDPKRIILGEGEWQEETLTLPPYAACCWQIGR